MNSFNHSALSPNLGLLDARATGRTFFELRTAFLPVDFLDLCSIIEEIVLRDKIVLVGKYEKVPKVYKDALDPLIRERVFDLCVQPVTIKKLQDAATGQLRRAGQQAHSAGLTSATVDDADYEVTRLLGAEVELKVPTIALLRHLHNYGFTRRPRVDNTVCNLSANFHNIKQVAEQELREYAQRIHIRHISVPPIALEIVQQINSIDRLADAILEKRHEYRHLRSAMTSLSETLADPQISIEKRYQLIVQWEQRWQKATDRAITGIIGIGDTSASLLEHGIEFMAALYDQHYIGVAINALKLSQDVSNFVRQRLFRPVHYSVRNYIKTGPIGMVNAVSRLFDIAPQIAYKQMAPIANSSSVWKAALAGPTKTRALARPRDS